MKYVYTVLIAVVSLALVAAPATADWDPNKPDEPVSSTNHKMHWPQMPDLENGMNVLASPTMMQDPATPGQMILVQKVLADDFRCDETGFIRGVHIWGSWLFDQFPQNPDDPTDLLGDPGNVVFRLSFHKNIPVGPEEYSIPGPEAGPPLFFDPGQFAWRDWPSTVEENFWDPNIGDVIGWDNQIIQYNFRIKDDLWWQDKGEIYWLDVTAYPGPPVQDSAGGNPRPDPLFGWKTSDNNWMDDAVYWDELPDGTSTFPIELYDYRVTPPPSLDMAFVITPEPGTVAMLLGAGLMGLVGYARRRRKR